LALLQAQSPAPPAAVTAPQIGPQHYKVFRGDGTPASLEDVLAEAGKNKVTFLGESHDDPVGHHLQFELFKKLSGPHTVLSMEMFETDVQLVVDEFLAGQITEEHLVSAGRAWRNYRSDYKPLVDHAKANGMRVIAANAARRYVNMVSRGGKESLLSLSKEAKKTLPPLPYAEATPEYQARFEKIMEEGRRQAAEAAKPKPEAGQAKPAAMPAQEPKRDPRWGLQAQSLWDASMAYSISRALKKDRNARVIHLNGSFHSEQRQGILDHLRRYNKKATMLVVTMIPRKTLDFEPGRMKGAGDFVIVTDESLPRSGPPPAAPVKPAPLPAQHPKPEAAKQ